MDNVTYYSEKNIICLLLVPHAIFSVIATVFVGLRIYTGRRVTKTPWQMDEYISIAALLANHTLMVAECVGASVGFGANMLDIVENYPGGMTAFLKGILATEIAYGIACPLSKMAVLAMYYRIFSSSRVIRYCGWAIGFGLAGWGISVVIVSIFTCNPVQAFWNTTMTRTCINSTNFYIGITVPNIIFDVMTVILPIHQIWRLQMDKEKKLALTGVFLLGGSVVLASVARLVLFCIYRPGAGSTGNNLSQTVIIPHTASALETCLAIIGACLPPCAPLFKRVFGRLASTVSGGSKSNNNNANNNRLSKNVHSLVTIGRVSNRSGSHKHGSSNLRAGDGSFERLGDGSSHDSMDDLCAEGHQMQNLHKA